MMKSRVLLPTVFVLLLVVILFATQKVLAAQSITFDGTWKGSGKFIQGLPFQLIFTIKNNSLVGLVYQFPGNDGVECFAVEDENISPAQQLQLTDNKLNGSVGSSFDV